VKKQRSIPRIEGDAEGLTNIVTSDEIWIYGYDVQTKAKSLQWVSKTSPTPNKARQVRSNVKMML